MKTNEEALAALAVLQRRSGVGRLIMAFGILAAAAALVLLTILVQREQRHAAEAQIAKAKIEDLTRHTVELSKRARLDLAEARRNPARSAQLITQALQQISAVQASLAETQVQARPVAVETAPPKIATLPETPGGGTAVVARGPVTGWDVDVFWCDGAALAQNYETARAISIILGDAALAKTRVGDGVALGRVRLRSARLDRGINWFRGQHVISDGGIGEDDAANAVVKYLSAKQVENFSVANSKTARTRYYLSVFACNPPR